MWVLGLVIMIDQVDQNLLRGVQTNLQKDLHLSDAKIGILLSAFIVVNGLISVPAGYLADRFRRNRTVGHTIVAWSGLSAATAVMPNYASLVAVRGALGFGQAITEPCCASLLADYYPAEERGLAFSIQQSLLFVGFGLGVALGGAIAARWGWRWAFPIVSLPGMLIAVAAYRLREPKRGAADMAHVGMDAGDDDVEHPPMFEHGVKRFFTDMLSGLAADLRTIWDITTMKYALVGVSTLLFTVTAIGAGLPKFYEEQMHQTATKATSIVGALVILGGIPGVILGGRLADRFATRIKGARMAIPAYCLLAGNALFVASWIPHLPLGVVFLLEVVGFFVTVMAIPSLRAGLSDAVPAHLRGAGFGAFNLVSVVFGQAAASIIVFSLAGAFGNDIRTAFFICSPPVFIGALVLLQARNHLDADAAKIFEAILKAMQQQQDEASGLDADTQ
jgi:MFS transporter, Spinster family, sphingosine-1-phosphate transporter